MFIACVIVTVFLSVSLMISATGKLTKSAQVMAVMRQVGVPEPRVPALAAVEVAGAVGLLIGLAVEVLGVIAAVGVVLYFTGAVVSHLRVRDPKGVPPAAFLLLVSVAALVLRSITT